VNGSDRPLRIGIPISTFSLGKGLPGIDKYTYHLILALERTGEAEIRVFQDKYRENGPFDRFEISYFPVIKEWLGVRRPHPEPPVGASRPGTPAEEPAGPPSEAPVERGGRVSPGGGPAGLTGFAALRRDIVKSLCYMAKKVDVIHYPTHMERPLALRTARTVLTFHDLVPRVHPETSTPEIIRKFDRCVARLRHVDALITDSEFSRGEMVEHLGIDPDRISVCYPGVDRRFFLERADAGIVGKYGAGAPYVLFVGTLEPRKNIEALVDAFASLEDKEVRLLLVGKAGWGYERIRRRVEELGLGPRVDFLGYVPEEDLPHLYRGARAFVYPSFYEGFGIPVIEAMAAGAPVVTSNVSSLPEVAGDAALLVPPGDVREIRTAVSRLLGDPDLGARLRARGVERARRFTWERCAEGVLEVYRGER
jgi:glycosyltransferase involved in cell wall biosynthesis